MDNFHKPVLINEAVDGLNIKKDGVYVDATVGGGGHTAEILKRGGKVIGIDQDEEAISHVKKKFESQIENGSLTLITGNFSDIKSLLALQNITEVDGILMDLGVSSYQLDASVRGFSFMRDEPLDMRMSQELTVTAADIVNKASLEKLYEIFSRFGEERKARSVAVKIVEARKAKPFSTTGELVRVILPVIPRVGDTHPATRIFQALRIAVNDELNVLRDSLEDGFKLLTSRGRLSIITFHSLEDRIVKLFAVKQVRESRAVLINKKPIAAGDAEVRANRRSRSAKLRVIEKI